MSGTFPKNLGAGFADRLHVHGPKCNESGIGDVLLRGRDIADPIVQATKKA